MGSSIISPNSVLGLDIGRVIVAPSGVSAKGALPGADDVVEASAPASIGVFTALPSLVDAFDGQVWLVSSVSEPMQIRTRAWLAWHRFFERTGIRYTQLVFCIHREEKAGICQSLGITHFVDDRLDILTAMEGIVAHRYWFTANPAEACQTLAGIKPIRSWQQPDLLDLFARGVRS